jgi:hypothetical protein
MFKRLFAWYNTFPQFLDYVHGFGFKLREEDDNFGGYDRQLYFQRGDVFEGSVDYGKVQTFDLPGHAISMVPGTNLWLEFCYCLRYIAKHGREQQNPWSLRQTAVYQRYDSTSRTSKWMIIQPSERLQVELTEYLELKDTITGSVTITSCDAHTVHAMVFSSTERNWREYMNTLQRELSILVSTGDFIDLRQE